MVTDLDPGFDPGLQVISIAPQDLVGITCH